MGIHWNTTTLISHLRIITELCDKEEMTSLPESVGECTALQTLNLDSCRALTSLPESLGECKTLQELILCDCEALTSLPDLSGLEQLKVYRLPDHLLPWEESGYKAFSVAS